MGRRNTSTILKMTDPWLVRGNINNQDSIQTTLPDSNSNASNVTNNQQSTNLQFEDNFLSTHNATNAPDLPNSEHTPLPDSKDYLQSLEKKLKKIKQNPKILEALSQKRAECMRNLLDDNQFVNKDETLDLDTPISSSDSAVQEIYRHIQPVQALSVGETVHIVKYDQLEADTEEIDGPQVQEDSRARHEHAMNSPFGEVFLFLTDLAWKSRMTIPVLVTTAFLIMDIRLQIEINIHSVQPAVELSDLDDDDSVEEYTTDSDDDDDDDGMDETGSEIEDVGDNDVLAELGRTH